MGAEFDQNTCTRELILTSLGYQLGRKSKPGLIPSISEVSQGALGRTGQKILSMAPPEKQLLPKTTADQITGFISQFSSAINHLLFPRNVMITQPEFETEGARAYFQKKKEKMLGVSFDDAFTGSDTYLKDVNTMLADMPQLPLPSARNNQLGWDDIYIFPTLRNLTMVKGLVWPAPVKQYVSEVAALCNIHLYDEQAV